MSLFGLFDDDTLGRLKKNATLRVPPPTPETGWRPPLAFPNLAAAVMISIDTETKETDFEKGGPGFGRGKGHIVGFSVGAMDAAGAIGKWYFPLRHEVEPEFNLDPAACFAWVKPYLENPAIPKVGANLLYDVGWLTEEGIYVQGDLHDVQFAEALLNEEGFINLEHLGSKYLKEGKASNILYEWCAQAYGGSVSDSQRANIWRASPRIVGLYGESDADLPLRVLQKQWPLLEAEGLMDVYRMECDSIPLLTQMRLTGVNIDLPAAESLYGELSVDIANLYSQLHAQVGFSCNIDSPGDLKRMFDDAGIAYPHTAIGNPSFTKTWLATVEHPMVDAILEIREYEKIRGTFIRSYMLERHVNGRVHCQFHPLRGDDGGTRSGRFSSDKPNLQNIPVRSKLGKRVRKLFIPDYGHMAVEKNDYSQIEYRLLAHFAVGPGSDNVRERYNNDPKTDYHDMTIELVWLIAKQLIDRKPIKNINFGLLYGMGQPKLARQIGIAKAVADEIFKAYHAGNPYVKATMDASSLEAQQLGYITTILGRRSRFNMWEPRQINYQNRARGLPEVMALQQYGADIIRSSTHKAINRRLQGSAADIIKKGMVRCYKEGVFDVIGVPKLQVHDELVNSVIDDSPRQQEAYRYMKHVLETAIPLRVPVLVDSGRGPNWGSIE